MINSMIEAVSAALSGEFGYETHMEEIKQGLDGPCFFISCLNPSMELFLQRRYFRRNRFVVQYFPRPGDRRRECSAVAERLAWLLEYVAMDDGLARGTGMEYEVSDGVLSFFVSYDCFAYREGKEEAPMEDMESAGNVKGG